MLDEPYRKISGEAQFLDFVVTANCRNGTRTRNQGALAEGSVHRWETKVKEIRKRTMVQTAVAFYDQPSRFAPVVATVALGCLHPREFDYRRSVLRSVVSDCNP